MIEEKEKSILVFKLSTEAISSILTKAMEKNPLVIQMKKESRADFVFVTCCPDMEGHGEPIAFVDLGFDEKDNQK